MIDRTNQLSISSADGSALRDGAPYRQQSQPLVPTKPFFKGIQRSSSTPSHRNYRIKQPNNKAWQIIDKYYENLTCVLSSDESLCQSVLECLHSNFLIDSCEKKVMERISCLHIKSKTVIGRVSIFISKGIKFYSSFANFVLLMEDFPELKDVIEEMKKDGKELRWTLICL